MNLPVFDENGTPVELTVDGLIAETDALKAEIRMIEKQRDDALKRLIEQEVNAAYLAEKCKMYVSVIRDQLKIIYDLRMEIADITGKGGKCNGTCGHSVSGTAETACSKLCDREGPLPDDGQVV